MHVKDDKLMEVHIGLDDIDSIKGGCTTHFAVKIAWELYRKGVNFLDYLNIIRLNPAVPWKTRGNGAVAVRFLARSPEEVKDVWEFLVYELEDYIGELQDQKHQPSIILYEGSVPSEFASIARKALCDLVPIELVLRVLKNYPNARIHAPRGKRGIIGAVAAIGYTMKNSDYTYELIAYRKREYWGEPRLVDESSVREMDKDYGKYTFLNYDYSENRVLITPRGPDPILYGLRGEDPSILLSASKKLRVYEPIEYIAIFRTNQHTDSHICGVNTICDIRPYMCVSVRGVVKSKPRRGIGGHLFFNICDDKCCIAVAVYEPTKGFRNIVEQLEVDDDVEALGCIRPPGPTHGLTLNLEKIKVVKLAQKVIYENPRCPKCSARMESAGRGKGFRCPKCGFRDRSILKTPINIERQLKQGWYQPPPSAFKHLMKPIARFGRERISFNEDVIGTFVFKYE
ncbi:MAG: tRNA(Ile)(2)-agmatinylcytidine synthase [Desulfurococcaceae archaeon]